MALVAQSAVRNRLLSRVAPEVFQDLRSKLTLQNYALRDKIIEPDTIIDDIFFPEEGVISLVTGGEIEIEISIVGREGLVGVPALLGVDQSPLRAMCQLVPCSGFTISVSDMIVAARTHPSLGSMLLRYSHCSAMQFANTAFSNGNFTVDQRLARWILMCGDRMDGMQLAITHEFLSMMLGVRRPGVTVATHVLEGLHMIRATRGRITILDRERLKTLADSAYGLAEDEYERVMGLEPGASAGLAGAIGGPPPPASPDGGAGLL